MVRIAAPESPRVILRRALRTGALPQRDGQARPGRESLAALAGSYGVTVPASIGPGQVHRVRPGKAWVVPRQNAARCAACCMASAP